MASKDTNAAASFAASMTSMGDRLQDVKNFDPSSSSSSSFHHPMVPEALMNINMHGHAAPPMMGDFMTGFHDPKLAGPMIPPPMQFVPPPQHAFVPMQRPGVPLDAVSMADEFARMSIAQPPPVGGNALAAEFERIYREPLHHAPPVVMGPQSHQWAAEFSRQHPLAHTMGPLHHQWATEFEKHHSPMHNGPITTIPPPASAASAVPITSTVSSAPATDQELEDIYGEAENATGDFESAYHDATSESSQWVNEFSNEQKNDGGLGVGGGLDREMLDKLMNSNDPKWRNSKFLQFINKISKGEIEFKDNQVIEKPQSAIGADWSNEFNQQQFGGQGMGAMGLGSDQWADEFSDQLSGGKNEAEWAEQFSDANPTEAEQWSKEFEDQWKDMDFNAMMEKARIDGEKKDPEYKFQSDNPYMNSANPFEEGVRALERGDLKNAILAFEAEVQKNGENAEAWCLLGQAQAENEEENNAIAALLKCISLDPYNLKALLMLGVSYTNDLEEHRALNYLKTWLIHNPEYQVPAIQQQSQLVHEYQSMYGEGEGGAVGSSGPGGLLDTTLHNEVTRLFHTATSVNPNDADVQQVLGVLYHISGDFDRAVDSFKHALTLRPNDATLWNKLGATQANSARSSEAVEAYSKALQLRPGYVRALANLAIAYANQGLHEDAVKWYLSTLKHNPNANHIWSYLRISLSHLGKDALIELSQNRNVELFRPYYSF